MKKKLTEWEKGFTQGYTAACANLKNMHDTGVEGELLAQNCYDPKELRRHGVIEEDIKVLAYDIKELQRKQKINLSLVANPRSN